MKNNPLTLIASASFFVATSSFAATLYVEEFDGNTNGYNPSSTTAIVGDNDWVDFSNRISSDSYTTAAGGAETVLAGTSSSGDPQVRSDFSIGIDKTTVESFILRLRVDKDGLNGFDDALVNADFNVFWGTDPYVNPGAANGNTQLNFNLGGPTSLVVEADGWHLATWTIASGGLTSGNGPDLNSVRIDPTNSNGLAFEVDSFTITGIPEPGSVSLIALGAVALGARRRRRSL